MMTVTNDSSTFQVHLRCAKQAATPAVSSINNSRLEIKMFVNNSKIYDFHQRRANHDVTFN